MTLQVFMKLPIHKSTHEHNSNGLCSKLLNIDCLNDHDKTVLQTRYLQVTMGAENFTYMKKKTVSGCMFLTTCVE